MTSFARKVLNDLPAPTNTGAANNLQILQEFTNRTPKAGGKVDVQISPTLSLFGRVGWRDADIFDNPPISRTVRRRAATRETYVTQQAVLERLDLYAERHVAARSALRLVDHEGGQESRGARRRAASAEVDVRHHRAAERSARRGGPADAVDHRLLGPWPAGDQPAVAVSDGLQSEGQLHLAAGPPLAQDRLRVPARADRSAGRQPALRPRFLRRPVLEGGVDRGQQQPLQPRRLHVRRALDLRAQQHPRRRAASRTCTSCICRTTGA